MFIYILLWIIPTLFISVGIMWLYEWVKRKFTLWATYRKLKKIANRQTDHNAKAGLMEIAEGFKQIFKNEK